MTHYVRSTLWLSLGVLNQLGTYRPGPTRLGPDRSLTRHVRSPRSRNHASHRAKLSLNIEPLLSPDPLAPPSITSIPQLLHLAASEFIMVSVPLSPTAPPDVPPHLYQFPDPLLRRLRLESSSGVPISDIQSFFKYKKVVVFYAGSVHGVREGLATGLHKVNMGLSRMMNGANCQRQTRLLSLALRTAEMKQRRSWSMLTNRSVHLALWSTCRT